MGDTVNTFGHLADVGKQTHSGKLERWLGAEQTAHLSRCARDFYWPVAVHGVPGKVYAMPGGDFAGEMKEGYECSAVDRAIEVLKVETRRRRATIAQHQIAGSRGKLREMDRRQHAFASLSALIAAATGGKAQWFMFQKIGPAANAVGNGIDPWTLGNNPAAGAAGAAAPGGTVWSSGNTGGLNYQSSSANTGHFVTGMVSANVSPNTCLVYDRLFSVAKTINSTSNENVTGVPTRYQNTTSTSSAFIGGNFLFMSVPTTVLAGTAHNWAGCNYINQANANIALPTIAGVSAAVKNGIDMAPFAWFAPLATTDVGVKAIGQMNCSALVATGTVDFVIGHPLAFMPCPVTNMLCVVDGINTAFNLTPIMDGACIAFLDILKPATTTTGYTGQIMTCYE